MTEVSFTLESKIEQPMDIQVFTRDGRHLAGRALTEEQRLALVDPLNGFVSGATYSTDYLNKTG